MEWIVAQYAVSLFLFLCFCSAGPLYAETQSPKALLLEVSGTIGPATADYLDRSLSKAESEATELVLLQMDTPGGLDTSMRAIIKRIIASRVPVVTYVAPSGARAASAGTYILYASHIAAMAPATNLGAATPVTLGGTPNTSPDKSKPKDEQESAPPPAMDAKNSKAINDAAAYIRSLAKLRNRNAEWAEKAVREAASLSAEEAVKLGVIDLVATDINALLAELNGKEVQLPLGKKSLNTQNIILEKHLPDWQSQLLSIISNPNLAYILMLVGIYGLIYEFANPGSIVPGTVGAITLLLALYGFHLLPINYAGVALILLGLSLMAAEAFVPSFGALGIGGVAAFIIGSLILIDTDQAGYGLSLPLILAVAASSAFIMIFVIGMAIKSRNRPVVSGREEMLTSEGVVVEDFSGEGEIRVHGEIWQAHSAQPLKKDQLVEITGREGLILKVMPTDKEK
ncbi:serine protease [Candidatus Thiodiazotropha endoloripes]|uniref:Serine protease n=1 Tax=Candidatus Thiodiazotropha endoloripes TaxID=1818881 RepID=A0A1E2UH24_9GAMM|nr:serine protease [Candidatus Thiodiazotropha endoloripes]ODB82728.1 serine protease [Candidatus Thiodiazotropha endoloripes]ODB83006.1 serine protease [Candidatus Thiodiazotropha endoloripes]ODB91921.1 serine protease [Candidatus Thiodiazotropha endoloripes]